MSKFKTLIACFVLTSLVGCSTVTETAQYDLARMAPDCRNGQLMVTYLESQLSEDTARSYRGTAKELIWDTKQDCQL